MSKAGDILNKLTETVYDRCAWVRLDLMESDFSKIYLVIRRQQPFAQITAWRNTSAEDPNDQKRKLYNVSQNRERNISLINDLRSAGLGGVKVKGHYQEEGATTGDDVEESFFVPYSGHDLEGFKNTILSLARKYNQDSVIFSDGKQVFLLSSSGSVWMTFNATSFSVNDLTGAWTQVRGRRFRYLESAVCIGNVWELELSSKCGIISDRANMPLKDFYRVFSEKGVLSEHNHRDTGKIGA